jgi:hypothetical protein
MAVKLDINCSAQKQCRFSDKCILINPIRTLDPNNAGGDFCPVLKTRLIRNDLQLRCFSFAEKGDR